MGPRIREDDRSFACYNFGMYRRGFTLIELLVVIAIVAVLAVVVVLVLNPAALLQQGRDSNRLSDMATIQSAVNYYLTDQPGVSIGSSSVVYVSVPDPTATTTAGDQCQGLGLPSLPAAYSYHCAASSTFRMTNATGWIPVNLAAVSVGSPLGQLPVDPTNSTSSRFYYTYTTNGSQYEITAVMESAKYKFGGSSDVISGDGGTLAGVVEKGSKLGLEPLDYGDSSLVGLWTFEEGSSSIAYDYSGYNATGSWNGTPTGTAGYYSAGRVGSWAGTFDGTSTYVNLGYPAQLQPSAFLTASAWVKTSVSSAGSMDILRSRLYGYEFYLSSGQPYFTVFSDASHNLITTFVSSLADNSWHMLTGVYNGANVSLYIDGTFASTTVNNGTPNVIYYQSGGDAIGRGGNFSGNYWGGSVDDVRIYNRALSAAEVSALYNGGK